MIVFVEKYGMPWLHGTFNAEALKQFYSVDDYQTAATLLKNDLEDLVQDGIVVNSQGIDISVVAPAQGQSNDIYDRLLYNCKAENAETILGHTGTAMSTPGKLGSEQAAIEVRDDIVQADSGIVENTMDTLIDWIFELNYNETEKPWFAYLQSDSARLDIAEEGVKITQAGGKLTKEWFKKKLNLDDEDFDITEPESFQKNLARAHELFPEIPENELIEMMNLLYEE